MSKTWVTADPHFGHLGMCKFTKYDGSKLRPWDHPDEMDEALVERWNEVVGDNDRVYLLGDVAFNNRTIEIVRRLSGRIVLVKGNHDQLKIDKYVDLFDDVRAVVQKKGFVMTHVPIHPQCMDRWGVNIHGHLHANQIDDPRYVCVSVERNNFYPVNLQDILDGKFK